jgi:hypothetical protein
MNTLDNQTNQQAVLGQKHAFATASLLLGIASFISLLGLEKGVLAMIFGLMALKAQPSPCLTKRRGWAKAGVVLGALHVGLLLAVLLVGWPILLGFVHYAADVSSVMLHGQKTVMSAKSPDGEFTAYVEDLPSFDPPNQALFVERKDQRHFVPAGKLSEDVDSIEQILWSPDSSIVVFHSRDYLTALRVTDWTTIRIYLGREWTCHSPGRRTTFSSGCRGRAVTAIQFENPDTFTYRLKDEEPPHTVKFGSAKL